MICDVLGIVADVNDAWDGANVDVLTDSDSEVSSSLRTRRIAAWSSIMITSRFPQLSWRKHLHGWHHVKSASSILTFQVSSVKVGRSCQVVATVKPISSGWLESQDLLKRRS